VADESLKARANVWQVVATNAIALALGLVVLFALSRFRLLFSPLALGLIAGALALYLAAGVLLWLFRGIREVEVSVEGISLVVGRSQKIRKIAALEIGGIRLTRRFGRRRIWIPSKRLAIIDDGFSREDFESIVKRMEEIFSISIER
jgi:hypothetical protein